MKKLIADLDHGTQLIRRERGLTELGIGLRDFLTLIDPLRLHDVGGDGDLAGAAVRADNGGELTEDVILLQCLHQTALKLVRHGITALGVLTDTQGVAHGKLVSLVADHVPECVFVLIGRGTLCLGCSMALGLIGHGAGGRSRERSIEGLLLLQSLDLLTERQHI